MTVVIIGAGDTGAALARQLAAASLVPRIVLVDEAASIAAGKALDIAQSGAIDRFSTRLAGTADESAVVGAGIVVIADRAAASGEWEGDTGLALIRRVSRLNQVAPILCVDSSSSGLVDHGVGELRLSPTRIFGTAPAAFQVAVVALTALEADQPPAEVSLSVVGRAPMEIIVGWEAASIGGRRAVDVLSPPAILRLEERLPRLWPPGPTTLGCAAADVIRSMLTRSGRTHALLVAGASVEATLYGRCLPAMLPARVDRHGIRHVEMPSLSPRERTRLETVLGAPSRT